jgi:hypothetical protein
MVRESSQGLGAKCSQQFWSLLAKAEPTDLALIKRIQVKSALLYSALGALGA